MLLVLAVHANYFSIGTPSLGELREHVVPTVTRVFLEAACLVCVNVFVLISGWFGIRRSVKGGVSYIFQCLFYSVVIYGLFLLLRLDTFSHIKMFEAFYVYRGGGWFVVAYLGLYILAPVLNAYIEKVSVRQLAMTVLGFYVFQTIFGCVGHYDFFSLGYSTLSFVGLYMLARLIRKSGWILPPPNFELFSWYSGYYGTSCRACALAWIRRGVYVAGILFAFCGVQFRGLDDVFCGIENRCVSVCKFCCKVCIRRISHSYESMCRSVLCKNVQVGLR